MLCPNDVKNIKDIDKYVGELAGKALDISNKIVEMSKDLCIIRETIAMIIEHGDDTEQKERR